MKFYKESVKDMHKKLPPFGRAKKALFLNETCWCLYTFPKQEEHFSMWSYLDQCYIQGYFQTVQSPFKRCQFVQMKCMVEGAMIELVIFGLLQRMTLFTIFKSLIAIIVPCANEEDYQS